MSTLILQQSTKKSTSALLSLLKQINPTPTQKTALEDAVAVLHWMMKNGVDLDDLDYLLRSSK